jgi:hypothetical protein
VVASNGELRFVIVLELRTRCLWLHRTENFVPRSCPVAGHRRSARNRLCTAPGRQYLASTAVAQCHAHSGPVPCPQWPRPSLGPKSARRIDWRRFSGRRAAAARSLRGALRAVGSRLPRDKRVSLKDTFDVSAAVPKSAELRRSRIFKLRFQCRHLNLAVSSFKSQFHQLVLRSNRPISRA